MEVQQEGETFGLDAFAQAHHIVQVLADLGVRIAVRVFAGGVHEQAHPQGVPAHVFALHVFQDVGDFTSVRIIIGDTLVVIALQYGNVAAHIQGGFFRLRFRSGLRLGLGGLSAGSRQACDGRQINPNTLMSHETKIKQFPL